ncbi:DUF1493 family protein [Enterobacteriaceae bacterium 89]|nr:DUF1493 family protein [Enterobacteriaceae bacterium 89]
MIAEQEVLQFFREQLSTRVTWRGKRIPIELDTVLQDYTDTDELLDTIEDFGEKFSIDLSMINMPLYYPFETLPLLERWFKADKEALYETRLPLTVRMFAESARAGRWLYD